MQRAQPCDAALCPWTAAKSIADGASILDYVRDTAREGGIEGKVRFGHRAVKASWSAPRRRAGG